MADDRPGDAQDALAQLFAECGAALEDDDLATARETIDSAEATASELPEGDLRAHLLHGCSRVSVLLDPDEEIEVDAAAEYVDAMRRRLSDEN